MRQQVKLVVMLICVYVWAWSIPTYAQSKLEQPTATRRSDSYSP